MAALSLTHLLQVRAEEVVLCGGAINSPQLLQVEETGNMKRSIDSQLSGVGDGDQLRKVGVEVQHHLPGVGANLQVHIYPLQKYMYHFYR